MPRIAIAILAIIVAATFAACGETTATSQEPSSSEEITTTDAIEDGTEAVADSAPVEVDISTVENAFAVSIGHRAEKIEADEPNSNIVVKDVDCQRTAEGKAICYVHSTISIGGYAEPYDAAWNVTYDLEDGHPLAYKSR